MKPNPFYINQPFNQFEIYQASALRWNIDFKKIDRGAFFSELTMLDYDLIQVGKTNIHSTVKQVGLTPEGFRTFAFSADKKQQFGWLNKPIDSNYLLCFPKDNTIDGYSKVGFNVFTISIKNEWLDEIVHNEKLAKADRLLKSDEFALEIDFNTLEFLRSFILAIFNKARQNPYAIYSESLKNSMHNRLPKILLNFVNGGELNPRDSMMNKSDDALFSAMKHMMKNSNKKIPISQLCKDLKISERTLEYAFSTRLGVTPKYYSKALKLQAVRRGILAQTHQKPIASIAQTFGFNHLGQFAADYKNHFGELPSETAAKINLNN